MIELKILLVCYVGPNIVWKSLGSEIIKSSSSEATSVSHKRSIYGNKGVSVN